MCRQAASTFSTAAHCILPQSLRLFPRYADVFRVLLLHLQLDGASFALRWKLSARAGRLRPSQPVSSNDTRVATIASSGPAGDAGMRLDCIRSHGGLAAESSLERSDGICAGSNSQRRVASKDVKAVKPARIDAEFGRDPGA